MNSPLRIIFMGTPDFAVPSLEILVQNQYQVVAVITSPDKPAGRGLKLTTSPVKDFALSHGIPVLQPDKLKAPAFLDELKSYQADLQIIVAFRMLPEVVWSMPRLGSFNLHASLLPQYRGAAPINWAIIRGEKETGLTTFFLQHEIDTGPIIFQEREPIYDHDNAGSLYERLMHKGANLVLKTVQSIEQSNYPQVPQNLSEPIKTAPKLFKENCGINWNQPAQSIHNFVRGLSPYPTAWTMLKGKICKIYQTSVIDVVPEADVEIGDYWTDNKTVLWIKAQDKPVIIEELQMEGKKKMAVTEFLRGNPL
jgi:methionyl-tRNA formyltransferase